MFDNPWEVILEAMEQIESDIMNEELPMDPAESEVPTEEPVTDDNALLDELNKVFTPVLVMQGLETGVQNEFKEACSQDNVLTEQNIIKFDDSTRMAQLIAVCALLIEKQKGSPLFDTYQKAATLKKNTKLQIQKKNYNEAKILAQKYLVKVSTTNNSSVARQAANDLLPETQH